MRRHAAWIVTGALLGLTGCDGPDEAVVPGEGSQADVDGPQGWGSGGAEEDEPDVEGESGTGGADDEPGDAEPADEVPEACGAPAYHEACDADSDDPFAALGLGCGAGSDASIAVSETYFESPDSRAWAVASRFGGLDQDGEPYWGASEGDAMLVLSTGVLPDVGPDRELSFSPSASKSSTDNGNPGLLEDLPAPMTVERGSAGGEGNQPFVDCDGAADCSDTLARQWGASARANDLIHFGFEVEVPPGVHGYEIDFAWFSAEFPEFVGSSYNDMFVIWQVSEAYTGNVTFVNNDPLTVTAVGNAIAATGHFGNDPALAGTGFDGVADHACSKPAPWSALDFEACPLGGATGWQIAKGPAVPGETLELSFAIFDKTDAVLDTVALLDDFRWDCVPAPVDPV